MDPIQNKMIMIDTFIITKIRIIEKCRLLYGAARWTYCSNFTTKPDHAGSAANPASPRHLQWDAGCTVQAMHDLFMISPTLKNVIFLSPLSTQ